MCQKVENVRFDPVVIVFALLLCTQVEWYEGIALEPLLYCYMFSTETLYALKTPPLVEQYRKGSETIVEVPARELRWRSDLPSVSTEQCELEWRRYRKAADLIDHIQLRRRGPTFPTWRILICCSNVTPVRLTSWAPLTRRIAPSGPD